VSAISGRHLIALASTARANPGSRSIDALPAGWPALQDATSPSATTVFSLRLRVFSTHLPSNANAAPTGVPPSFHLRQVFLGLATETCLNMRIRDPPSRPRRQGK
jgi:hypothetical protein